MSIVRWCGVILSCVMMAAMAADAPQLADFAWRGTLALPAGASLARVELPVQAMLHMQSSAAHDLRVFNATGAVVPFAVLGGADLSRPAPAAMTAVYKAYPLFAASTPDPRATALIKELGLQASATASRDLPGWKVPERAVVLNTPPPVLPYCASYEFCCTLNSCTASTIGT